MSGTDRDRAVEVMLARVMGEERTAPTPSAGGCPDADLLAAWFEGGVGVDERTRLEAHAADCAQCQAALGLLASLPPTKDTLRRSVWSAWRLGWLVPLSAGAAAVALWFAVPAERQAVRVERPTSPSAYAPSAPSPPAAGVPADAPAAGADRLAKREALPQPAGQPSEGQPPGTAVGRTQESVELRAQAEEAAAAPAAASPGAPAPSSAPARQRQNDALSAPRAADEPATVRPAGRRDGLAEREALAAPEPPTKPVEPVEPVEIVAPDPRVRWRIRSATPLEQSTDGGRTWEAASIPATTALTAGVAPSAQECWLVGPRGAVFVTFDGRTWRQVAVPVPVDLVAVQSPGGRTATVTAADGRIFHTSDGGVRWTERK